MWVLSECCIHTAAALERAAPWRSTQIYALGTRRDLYASSNSYCVAITQLDDCGQLENNAHKNLDGSKDLLRLLNLDRRQDAGPVKALESHRSYS